jgi:hypothetical protein
MQITLGESISNASEISLLCTKVNDHLECYTILCTFADHVDRWQFIDEELYDIEKQGVGTKYYRENIDFLNSENFTKCEKVVRFSLVREIHISCFFYRDREDHSIFQLVSIVAFCKEGLVFKLSPEGRVYSFCLKLI